MKDCIMIIQKFDLIIISAQKIFFLEKIEGCHRKWRKIKVNETPK